MVLLLVLQLVISKQLFCKGSSLGLSSGLLLLSLHQTHPHPPTHTLVLVLCSSCVTFALIGMSHGHPLLSKSLGEVHPGYFISSLQTGSRVGSLRASISSLLFLPLVLSAMLKEDLFYLFVHLLTHDPYFYLVGHFPDVR